MNKKEIAEIKKLFTPSHCAITRICGCYVDAEKNIKTKLKEAFLSLEEEEMFKYFKIFKSTLSGTIGKNLLNMEFPLSQESEGGTQEFLLKLRNSELKNEALIDEFYEKVMADYLYPENYYIILIHGAYDVPGRASDNLDMDDASDYVYEFILCSICPVKLDKPGLCYNVSHNTIENRVQDWVVGAPENGFLFPAFTDRNTDIHNLLYFTKNAEMDQPDFLDHFLGCQAPLSAKSQKETFQSIIEETLDSACDFSTVMTIQENLNTMIEERKDDPEPVVLDKHEVKRLLASSGVPNEQLDEFDEKYESIADEKASFVASNVASTRNYEIRTPDVIIKVSPEKAQLIETRMIPNFNSQMTASLSHCPKKKAAVPDKRAAAFSSFYLCLAECFSKCNACCLSFIIWRVCADHAVAYQLGAIIFAAFFPGAHPLAVSPSIGTEQSDFLSGEFGFTCGEHWLELGIFQLFCPHSRASESDCIVCIYIIRREICASQNRNFCACLLCSLCYFLCHHFCVAGSTPINYCYFAHVSNPSFFIF